MPFLRLFTYVVLFGLLPASAHALRIGNCDKAAHRVTYAQAGATHTVTLAPWKSVTIDGPPPTVGVDGEPVTRMLNVDYQYCIWHDGLAVQRRNPLTHVH